MPVLEFLLENSQLIYRAEKDSEEWALVLDAKLQKNYDSFEVFLGSDIYDGFGLDCLVKIKQRTPQNTAWVERSAGFAQEASDGNLSETALKKCLGKIALIYWQADPEFKPYFEITILLPTDEFFRVQAYFETCLAYLHIETNLFSPGLIYGDDPDGRDLKWLADKVEVAIAESMSLRFTPHPIDTLDPESSPVVEPQDRPLPIPVVVNADDLSRGINRLLWVVIFIGMALILKAYV